VKQLLGPLFVLTAFVAMPRTAAADTMLFGCLSGAMTTNCDSVATQLSLEITQTGDWINFKFLNTGSSAMTISGLYLSDPLSLLTGDPTFSYNTSGITFTGGCNPNGLPGDWGTTDCASAISPSSKYGVNPFEWVQLSYLLQSPGTENLATLLNTIYKDKFNIGIKVQGFSNGGSEWAVAVPEPGTLALFLSGLSLAALRRRRNRNLRS
jgi:hypothetical protein